MSAGGFRSKLVFVGVTIGICAVFFAVSRMKHRRQEQAENAIQVLRPGTRDGVVEQVALLKRTEESAQARGDSAVQQRRGGKDSGSSYDDAGNVYHRRATPDPIKDQLTRSSSDNANRVESARSDAVIVPALRIHGHKTLAPGSSGTLTSRNSLESFPPGATTGSSGVVPGRSAARTAVDPRRPDRFVPFGRLIKAELVITLESTQDEMPLVGLIVEPVYNNGKLVIPAGTELHSSARPDRVRDRIVSTTTWRLIFPREGDRPNGRQITFDGVALDREDGDGNGLTWGIDDGSYGLRGRTVRAGQTQQELLLFAAEALRAVGGTVMERQTTVYGAQVESNLRNAGLAGGQAVLEHYAEGINKEIQRNGVYIQVPAGKQFYVYPRQVIDPDRADIPQNIANVE